MTHRPHQLIALGGSFDHFHAGHQKFLKFAASLSEKIIIGITSDSFIKKKTHAQSLEKLKIRIRNVRNFCESHKIKYEIVILNDIYGTTLENKDLEALVVTAETLTGAEKINQARKLMHEPELKVYVCDLLVDDAQQELHSANIRSGKVSREGKNYERVLKQSIKISEAQKIFLRKPLGKLVEQPKIDSLVTVVGDTALEKFMENNWRFNLGIFDHKRQRQVVTSKIIDQIKTELTATNPAGSITQDLVAKLQLALAKKIKYLFVEGEEDLATVALILLLPLNSFIYYGQPGRGMVEVKVDERMKDKVYDALSH